MSGSIAAAARLHADALLEALALAADELAADLAARLGMVAWEREEQIGAAQRRLVELRGRSFSTSQSSDEPARVRELRDQPLEALPVAWEALLRGRRVHVESEAEACPGVSRILRELADQLGGGVLTVSAPGKLDHAQASWPRVGVEPRSSRVALIQADADRELAAYVLARACLRRTGFDPRVVHRVIVVGSSARLEQNLRRLWVGAQMGPVADEHAFAGPVEDERAERFMKAEADWRAREGVTTICPGARLHRSDAPGELFLAPALFRASLEDGELPVDEPPLDGPILVVYPVPGAPAGDATAAGLFGERLLEHFAGSDRGHLRFGAKPRELSLRAIDGQIHGALLVERLPPGLPEPRP